MQAAERRAESATAGTDHERVLRQLLGEVRVVFQPVVDLATGVVVAHEALVRGTPGSEVESAPELFDRARLLGLAQQLDWMSLELALVAVSASGRWAPTTGLFVNVETSTLQHDLPVHLMMHVIEAPRHAVCLLEVGCDQLLADPPRVLQSLRRFRDHGWRIALTGVGPTARSFSTMSLLDPDIVKLAPDVVDGRSPLPSERVKAAIDLLRERTGALIVAEGVESSLHSGRAWELGIELAQGWWFGHPREVVEAVHGGSLDVRPPAAAGPIATPLPIEELGLAWRTSDEMAVGALVQRLLSEAANLGEEALVALHLGPQTTVAPLMMRSVASLAAFCGHLTVAGAGLDPASLSPARVVEVSAGDPLAEQTVVCVLAADGALGLAARFGDDGVVQHALTDDVDLVASMARSVLCRTGVWNPDTVDRFDRVLLGQVAPSDS